MKYAFKESHIQIIWFDFKTLYLTKILYNGLCANVPKTLGRKALLTLFECQRFNGTTKVDAIHTAYIFVLIRSYIYFSLKESQEFINCFCKWKHTNDMLQYICL